MGMRQNAGVFGLVAAGMLGGFAGAAETVISGEVTSVASPMAVRISSRVRIKIDVGLPKNAVLGRKYTEGTRLEPGDRTNAVEGVMSLDLRSLEDRAKDSAK